MTRMVKLYEGTLNKLDYASTKVHNMLNQFWIDGKVYDLIPDANTAMNVEDELMLLDQIIATGYVNDEWQGNSIYWITINKYTALADEFRLRKVTM